MNVFAKKNTKILTAKEAACHFGYSSDYIARLAREGKIVATRIDRQWHVDVDSLKLFTLQVEADKRVRQELLREERKNEIAKTQSVLVFDEQKMAVAKVRPMALALTSAFMVCVTLVASITFVAYEEQIDAQAMLFGADHVLELLAASFIDPWRTESPARSSGSDVVSGLTSTSTKLYEKVQASFSDEIQVEFDSVDGGVITPVFKDVEGESYRFLLVPVDASSSQAIL